MPSTDSWQERPYAIVDHIFGAGNHTDDGWVKAVLNEFHTKIDGTDALSAIPSLNDCAIQELLPNSLVRFRCMIQDSYENELFLQSCILVNRKTEQKIQKTSYFRDVIDCSNNFEIEHNPAASYGMRQVLYCVSIPGECDWTKKGWKDAGSTKVNCNSLAASNSAKRKRDDDDTMEIASTDKMSNEDGADENKRTKQTHEGSRQSSGVVFDKNHPLPGESGPVCLVKIYDESANFKINDIYEFYGILSVDPSLSNAYDITGDEMDAADAQETKAHHPPASLVPRLHVVYMKNLRHVNPYIGSDTSRNIGSQDDFRSVRDYLTEILKKAAFGDSLVSEYLLLHLLARVYSRHSGLALGKFSLNISGIPPGSDYPVVLCNFLKELVTKMHYLPMSTEKFNSSQFVPTKNYNTNRLDSGLLQLSDGTHIFVDETTLQPGNLTADGVKNIQALKDLVTFQKMAYNFQFSQVSFESDFGILVLSEGKSILPCDFQIELKPRTPFPADAKSYFSSFCSTISSEILDKCRRYITTAKYLEYELTENVSKTIQDAFVDARKKDGQVSADTLHSWLVLARLISISFGCQTLTTQKWYRVRDMEKHRIARDPVTSQANGH